MGTIRAVLTKQRTASPRVVLLLQAAVFAVVALVATAAIDSAMDWHSSRARAERDTAAGVDAWKAAHCALDRIEPTQRCSFCRDMDFGLLGEPLPAGFVPDAQYKAMLLPVAVADRIRQAYGGADAIVRGVTVCEKAH